MERVNKGERYWYIDSNLRVHCTTEINNPVDDDFFAIGNYFHTKEEAEKVAEKIRKLLKWIKCFNWLKSKIIK